MKILHLTNTFAPAGGIETYVLKLVALLNEKGHQNLIIYRESHARTNKNNGNPVFFVPYTTDWDTDREKILRIIAEQNPDIVYMHDVYDALLVQQLATAVPTVGYVHIFYPVCPGMGKLFHRDDTVCEQAFGWKCIANIYLRQCATARNPISVWQIYHRTQQYLEGYRQLPKVVVASEYMKQLMIQNGMKDEKLSVLPPHFISSETETVNTIGGDGQTVLFVGRLEYEKGIPYLLKAIERLPKRFRLIVTGDGSRQQEYKTLAEQMGLADRVQFLGWVCEDDLHGLYRQATVSVVPSIMPEPFGKVGIEAMANGCPVVAFDVGGISDWLIDGFNGFLVPSLDVEAFADRLLCLLNDPDLALRMGQAGKKYVLETFTEEKHIQQLEQIFNEVVRERKINAY